MSNQQNSQDLRSLFSLPKEAEFDVVRYQIDQMIEEYKMVEEEFLKLKNIFMEAGLNLEISKATIRKMIKERRQVMKSVDEEAADAALQYLKDKHTSLILRILEEYLKLLEKIDLGSDETKKKGVHSGSTITGYYHAYGETEPKDSTCLLDCSVGNKEVSKQIKSYISDLYGEEQSENDKKDGRG